MDPIRVLPFTSSHVRIDLLIGKVSDVVLAIVVTVSAHLLGRGAIQVALQLLDHWLDLTLVVGILSDPWSNDHLMSIINSRLAVVALLKRLGGAHLHDP